MDMKKYRLKQWYPSLPESIEVGLQIEIDSRSFCSNGDNVEYCLITDNPKMWISSKELHPDFWELIEEEKPLFTETIEMHLHGFGDIKKISRKKG